MIEVIKVIETEKLRSWLESSLKNHLRPDVSNYAKGRLRCWLGVEPTLTSPTRLLQGVEIGERNLQRLKELIEWDFDFCLATYSGDGETGIGISAHRDASYADYEAYSLNVSGEAKFSYWEERESFGYSKGTKILAPDAAPTEELILTPGTLTHFNCKNRHAAEPSSKRWGLNFWKGKNVRSY